jgi:hypothetical protein
MSDHVLATSDLVPESLASTALRRNPRRFSGLVRAILVALTLLTNAVTEVPEVHSNWMCLLRGNMQTL